MARKAGARKVKAKRTAAKPKAAAVKRPAKKLGGKPKPGGKLGPRVKRAPPAITFTEESLLRAKSEPPFDDKDGDYRDPDVTLPGGKVPSKKHDPIACVGSLVVYSSAAEWQANCAGFAGPAGKNSAVMKRAIDNAEAYIKTLTCESVCIKSSHEIWRGWSCNFEALIKKNWAGAAVEFKVECNLATKPD